MNGLDRLSFAKTNGAMPGRRLCAILVLIAATGLTACGSKEKKTGQSLVKVNGEEITVFQLNEELQRANVPPGQQEAAGKQLLESLIDRQLIIAEAVRTKIDRTPAVVGAIERAKAQIIAQAYLQDKLTKLTKPSKAEIDDYFQKNPGLFSSRKQFDMKQVMIASKDFNDELKAAIGSAKSLDEVVAWLEKRGVEHKRGQLSRTSAELPPEMSAKLLELPKNQLFVVNEGGNTLLVSIADIKDRPVTVKEAAPQIEQYLINKRNKEVADTEIAHLRSLAKIEYINASAPAAAKTLAAPETKPAGAAH